MQCLDLGDVLSFYNNLEDPAYEDTRNERFIQAEKILDEIQKYRTSGKFLDIGAGSGILVEAALQRGYNTEGIEPSRWLQTQAQKRGLPVHPGTIPCKELKDFYDIITIIDVIEHVSEPLGLLMDASEYLAPNGILIITTPDINSFFAKILGWKWWHFRVAHIGYFNKKTIKMAIEKAGFNVIKITRPAWYFTLEYIFERINKYLPFFMKLLPNSLKKIVIPLNLRDSLMLICKRQDGNVK